MNTFGVTVTARHVLIPRIVTALVTIAERCGVGYSVSEVHRSWLWGTTKIRIRLEAAEGQPIGPAVVAFQAMLDEVAK